MSAAVRPKLAGGLECIGSDWQRPAMAGRRPAGDRQRQPCLCMFAYARRRAYSARVVVVVAVFGVSHILMRYAAPEFLVKIIYRCREAI